MAEPYGAPRTGGKVLPFGLMRAGDDAIVIHFTIAEENIDRRQTIALAISKALEKVKIDGHPIVPVITGVDVTMTMANAKALAAHVVPSVLDALGMPRLTPNVGELS